MNMTPAKNPAAVALGKLAKGKPKRYPPAERERLRKRLAVLRERRWPKLPTGDCGELAKQVKGMIAPPAIMLVESDGKVCAVARDKGKPVLVDLMTGEKVKK